MIHESALSHLFSPLSLKGRTIRNRLVAQAMEINSAGPDGGVSEATLKRYSDLARGRWGIVFIEAVSVTRESLARKRGLVLDRETLDGFKRLIGTFRDIDPEGTILIQLTHSGINSGDFSRRVSAWETGEHVEVLTTDEVLDIRDMFFRAAGLAWEAGADGIDLKSCHGYLLGEFLRPSNRRRDDYGGSVKNRTRLHTEILRSVSLIHPAFIIGFRLSLYEGIRGGCGTPSSGEEFIEDLDDIMEATDYLMAAGADFFNVSAGIPAITPALTRPLKPSLFNLYHHMRYTREVKRRHPETRVIGSAYSSAGETAAFLADENIAKGYTDFAGFGRLTLADPMFPLHLGNGNEIHYCTLCSGCSRLLAAQKRVFCSTFGEDNRHEGI